MSGRQRQMRRDDVDRLLARGARLPNGKYRATLSRFADGRPLGYFKYYGTRPDDPNDIHPHEHRRELRANRVFAAWLNHDDSRGINSLDMLDGPDGRKHIRPLHVRLRLDHGQRQHRRAGAARRQRVHPRVGTGVEDAGDARAVRAPVDHGGLLGGGAGRSAASRRDFFDPVEWRPEYPNPAFDNMRARRRVLGGAAGGEVLGRGDPRGRRQGALQRTRRRRTHRLDADQAAGQGPARRG